MNATTKNGAPRKQLSEQIDRLDSVIDALDEGLKGAVADAVRQAVQSVLIELATNPELLQMLRQAAAPQRPATKDEEPPKPSGSLASRVWGRVCSAARSCASGINTALSAARLAWLVASHKAKALALAAVVTVAGVAYTARAKIARAASVAWAFGKDQMAKAGHSLGRLTRALAH